MASQGSVKAAAAMLNTVQARVPHKAASLVGKPASSELPEHRNKTTRGIIDTYAYFICPGDNFYRCLRATILPAWLPPECIVLMGFGFSCCAGLLFSIAAEVPLAGLLAAFCVYLNFVSDYMDGKHARATNQCRNGGEVLDHFFDPLSFSVIIWGIGACCESYNMAIICVLGIYCNATILFQEAMIMKTLEMKAIGPNEARVLYMCLGAVLSYLTICLDDSEFIGEQYCFLQSLSARSAATGFMWLSTALTIGQCVLELHKTVERVNKFGPPPDSTPWLRTGLQERATRTNSAK